jgi:hypothetical protein
MLLTNHYRLSIPFMLLSSAGKSDITTSVFVFQPNIYAITIYTVAQIWMCLFLRNVLCLCNVTSVNRDQRAAEKWGAVSRWFGAQQSVKTQTGTTRNFVQLWNSLRARRVLRLEMEQEACRYGGQPPMCSMSQPSLGAHNAPPWKIRALRNLTQGLALGFLGNG